MVRPGCLFNLAYIFDLNTNLFNKQRTNSHHPNFSVFKRDNTLHLNTASGDWKATGQAV